MTTARVLALVASLFAITAHAQTEIIGEGVDRPITNPAGLTVCNGTLYAVDALGASQITSGKIRSLNLVTGLYRTVTSGLNLPTDIACGPAGVLYVSETSGNKIRKVNADGTLDSSPVALATAPRGLAMFGTTLLWANWDSNGTMPNSVFALANGTPERFAGTGAWSSAGDGGLAVDAGLRNPWGLAYDAAGGNVYIIEMNGNKVRRVNGTTRIISTLGGNGYAGPGIPTGPVSGAQFYAPTFAEMVGKDLYVSDTQNARVRRIANVTDNGSNAIVSTFISVAATGIASDATSLFVSVPSLQRVFSYPLPGVTPQPTSTAMPLPSATHTNTVQPTATRTDTPQPQATSTQTSAPASPTPTSGANPICSELSQAAAKIDNAMHFAGCP